MTVASLKDIRPVPLTDLTARPAVRAPDDPVLAAQLRRATQRFEALFLETMLKSMDRSGDGNVLFGNGAGGEIYRTMVEGALSDELAETGPLGIAETLYRELAPAAGLSAPSAPLRRAAASAYGRHAGRIDSNPQAAPSVDRPPRAVTPSWFRRIAHWLPMSGEAARTSGVPDSLVAAVISVESDGNPTARSHRGARGLMQLMPATAQELGVRDPEDPMENLRGGSRYLRRLIDRFDGQLPLALAAYNAGPSRVAASGGIPPFPETRRYVERVLDRMRWLESPAGRRHSSKHVGGSK